MGRGSVQGKGVGTGEGGVRLWGAGGEGAGDILRLGGGGLLQHLHSQSRLNTGAFPLFPSFLLTPPFRSPPSHATHVCACALSFSCASLPYPLPPPHL